MAVEGVSDIDLLAKIGQGQFGVVYRATMQPHGLVAAKEIDCGVMAKRLGTADWAILRDHLFAEAETLRKAAHQHVVRVFSVHYDGTKKHVYIITELCDGGLDASIKNGPLPLVTVRKYVRHALLGLEALHGRGMIHRDLKPANILTTAGTAKLSDFGLVTDQLVAGYASQQGYLEHLAPEVIVNARTSTKSDVWAMGLTIYRLLNGQPWYADVQAALGIDWTDPPAAIHRVKYLLSAGKFATRLPWMPHVPDAWRRFVRKAMSDLPAKRFQNGGAMLTALSTLALPDEPSWECSVAAGNIVWRRTKETREEVAELKSVAALYDYHAISKPLAGLTGRRLTHAASKKSVTRKAALAALQAFFATRRT